MHQGGEIHFTYLNGPDIDRLAMTDDEILGAVEGGLLAQGRGETVIEPRVHLMPDPAFRGHFNVLRGYVAPIGLAGVKIVGDYVDNYKKGLLVYDRDPREIHRPLLDTRLYERTYSPDPSWCRILEYYCPECGTMVEIGMPASSRRSVKRARASK